MARRGLVGSPALPQWQNDGRTAASAAAGAETRPLSVCSPMPGRLLLSHPSHGEAFVSEGQHVAPNDILALVQVGPLYLPVRSPVAGTLKTLWRRRGAGWSTAARSRCCCPRMPLPRSYKDPLSGQTIYVLSPLDITAYSQKNNVKGRSVCRNRRGSYAIFRL